MPQLKIHVLALTATALAAAALLAALPAQAVERINTPKADCAAIQSTLVTHGAAILRHPSKRNPARTLYDRYVGDSRFCATGETGVWASVPSQDKKSCRVIACQQRDPEDLWPHNPFLRPWLRLKIGS